MMYKTNEDEEENGGAEEEVKTPPKKQQTVEDPCLTAKGEAEGSGGIYKGEISIAKIVPILPSIFPNNTPDSRSC